MPSESTQNEQRVFNAKIVLCGDTGVGKTSIRRNYMGLSFQKEHVTTLGADFSVKRIEVNNDRLDLQIWDLGGQDGYERLRSKYFSGARGAVMVFDLTNKVSFEKLESWYQELWKAGNKNRIPTIILGNKTDLENDMVSDEEIMTFINEFQRKHEISHVNYSYFRTSAKDGTNIEKAFQSLAKSMHNFVLEDLKKHS